MTKAITAPVAVLAVLITAGAAVSAPPPPNVLQVDLSADIDYVDPALSYYVPAWQIEYATCSRLVNYADASGPAGSVLRPEIAAGLPAVSSDGRTYTFTLRDDYFFAPPSNERVTAAHFKYAIDRTLNRLMNSPAQPFLDDIVGADEVINGQTTSVSGVVASGNTLTIQLKQPAGDFLARLAMPFSCPLPTSVPIDPDGIDAPVPSAGPYYVEHWTRNSEIVLKENPNYSGDRPHHFDEIHYTIGLPLETIKLRIEAGDTDFGDIPPAAHAELGRIYGPGSAAALAGRQRYFFYPANTVLYLAMNHDRPLFGAGGPLGNVNLKKAVNYAIDRTAMVEQRGAYAAEPTDQHLPPGIPGFRDVDIYPPRPDIARARELAGWAPGDPMRNGVFYCSSRAPAPQICEIVQANLREIGLEMEIKLFPRATQFTLAGVRGEPFDMTLEGWHADYYDPFDFLFLLDGSRLRPANNVNFAYFDVPDYNERINGANVLAPDARAEAFGDLDVDIAQNAAPWAAYGVPNDRLFFSDRVGCQTYVPAYGISLGALCLRPAISISDATVDERDSGSATATFTVSLAEAAAADYPVTVSYATADGTAAPSDYSPASGTVTFAAGEKTKTIAVDVSGDTLPEHTETFHVELSSPTHGTVVRSRGVGRIVNDDSPANPPLNIEPPTISGVLQDGSTLAATDGIWTGTPPISFSHAWARCNLAGTSCQFIPGGEGRTLTLTASDVSFRIRVVVTGVNSAGSSQVTSADTPPISPYSHTAPWNSAAPGISGAAVEDAALTGSVGTWEGRAPLVFSLQWESCTASGTSCEEIPDETSPTLRLGVAEVGRRIRLSVVARNIFGTATAHSALTAVVTGRGGAAVPRCIVPSVRGKTLRAARTAIRNRRCRVGRIRWMFSNRATTGRIIGQTPRAGARRVAGFRVNLVVSKGKRR